MRQGKIYLIPSPIAVSDFNQILPSNIKKIISNLDVFFVESIRTTRRFFSKMGIKNLDNIHFEVLNKDSLTEEIEDMIRMVKNGKNAGILSEAGCPGIADPGSRIIQIAHLSDIKIIPLSGPSSIFLALMASGFNGQNFVFHGYLPIEKMARRQKILELEQQSKKNNQTQIFMETPYRNKQLLQSLLEHLNGSTQLCIASDITGENEFLKTKSVNSWKKEIPDIHKKPTIFVISFF